MPSSISERGQSARQLCQIIGPVGTVEGSRDMELTAARVIMERAGLQILIPAATGVCWPAVSLYQRTTARR